MKKLSENFELERYGIKVRLVTEKDAQFILLLRTDPKLSRFIHETENDLDKQLEWIRKYKIREHAGLDYYFIYFYDDKPFGLNRIYDIHDDCGTGGSWVCQSNTKVEYSIATMLIERDILFDFLDLSFDIFDVRKGNKQVQKLHKSVGAEKIGETDLDFLYRLSRDDYNDKKKNIIKLLNL